MATRPSSGPAPRRAPAWRSPLAALRGSDPAQRRLQWAFAASLALHAVAMSITFTALRPAPDRDRDAGLEVILVNARHVRAPDKPDALAQANLDGGGESERNARPKSPLPPQDRHRDGDALIEARRRAALPEPLRQNVLTRPGAEAKIAVAPANPQETPPLADAKPSGLDLMDSAVAIARMEAEIDRKLDEYAKRPRKKFIGARTKEYRFAQYVEDWRQKIERVGTLNYPDAARGKLYGSLLLLVAIRADGSIERVEVQRSSGEPILDEAAKRIVQLAAPFAPFPNDIRGDTDILEIARTWTFTNADRITAN